MYSKILIRYGELTLKGKNRENFIQTLANNIKKITNEYPLIEHDRMYLSYSEKNMEKLQYVFGIVSYSPIIICENDITRINYAALSLIDDDVQTFKVSARRSNKNFEYYSADINQITGAFILKRYPQNLTVDVHNPDITIYVEIRQKAAYVFDKVLPALGGLPVGISGSVVHLMSGGIDSPVAAFELMKRGLNVIFLSFVSPPQTDQKTIDKMIELVKILSQYQMHSSIYIANYSKILNYLTFTPNEAYRINLMRRSFYRIASEFAKNRRIYAISNGENLGQVASQTLESLYTINAATDLLVLRPLMSNDKVETIKLAKEIGTYDLSITKANETCELFAPKQPVTRPVLDKALLYESELKELPELEKDLLEHSITEIIID
ncbi:tRNA uracil 4-sulfurtransferase ThiI [Mycoplasmopsis adleri]|uniref:tRNA uracil 4-sulfurtransferase ThiI n=1 Tax=Mycoplasmopsis adleri TaxID=51362 RepID=UPI00387366AF